MPSVSAELALEGAATKKRPDRHVAASVTAIITMVTPRPLRAFRAGDGLSILKRGPQRITVSRDLDVLPRGDSEVKGHRDDPGGCVVTRGLVYRCACRPVAPDLGARRV